MRIVKFQIITIVFMMNLLFISCKDENDNLVEIHFNFGSTLTWNVEKGQFEDDSDYKELETNYDLLKDEIIRSVLDTTDLNFKVCFKSKSKVCKGDLSIILLNSMESIPFSKIFKGSQYDNFRNCSYPMGLFDRIEKDRLYFVEKLKE